VWVVLTAPDPAVFESAVFESAVFESAVDPGAGDAMCEPFVVSVRA